MRQPKGKCRYCKQEFMSKQALAKHETDVCPKRTSEENKEGPANRFRMTHLTATGGQVWQR